jgi:hypothetical protein
MTLFIWIDENGEWRISHLPQPKENCLRIMCTEIPAFFNDEHREVEVEIR